MIPFVRNREEFEQHLVALHRDGWSIRGLARHFSIGRNTVRKILRKHDNQRDNGHDILHETGKRGTRLRRRKSVVPATLTHLLDKSKKFLDSEKTVVLRWEAGQPVFNPSYSAFITHYHCRPIACQRGRPETKGKIEKPFQYIENNLLAGRKFRDLDDLKACARWWLRKKSDLHDHDTTGRPPLELFLEQEQDALQPLPRHPYDCAEVYLRVCDLEVYIEFETNRYPGKSHPAQKKFTFFQI